MKVWSLVRALKDEIAILLSVLALAVSIVSVYLQVRESDAVTVRLVDMDAAISNSGKAVVQMVVSNAGNLPYLISEVKMVVSTDPRGRGYSYPSDGSSSVEGLPFVLNKGEMKLIKIAIPVAEIAGGAKEPHSAYLGAVITSANVYSELHRVELWYAAICVDSGMLVNGVNSSNKFTLKRSDFSIFSSPDLDQCP